MFNKFIFFYLLGSLVTYYSGFGKYIFCVLAFNLFANFIEI